MLLENKNAIVTGGSRGIGKAIVEAYLKQGANVWVLSRSEGPAADELKALAQELGRTLTFKSVDMGQKEQIRAVADTILEEAKTIDILVNNAGITEDGLLFSMKDEQWENVINVNLNSLFYLCQHLIKAMMRNRSGSIINMSSVVGLHGNVGQANYAASKGGVISFTKSLAQEVAKRGIRVNAIAPGFIASDMTNSIPEKVKNEYLEKIPMSSFGKPEEIADVALFLASNMSSYVTGEIITVSGGMGM